MSCGFLRVKGANFEDTDFRKMDIKSEGVKFFCFVYRNDKEKELNKKRKGARIVFVKATI